MFLNFPQTLQFTITSLLLYPIDSLLINLKNSQIKSNIKGSLYFQSKSWLQMSATINDHSTEPSIENEYISRKIFCNVELNGEAMEAVGFDMDFTLAQYTPEFDLLAFEGTKKKLVYDLGYPQDVLSFQFSAEAFRRGLIIDKKDGNIIKLDRHKYHRKVFHGHTELTTEERKISKYSKNAFSYTEPDFVMIDTLFLLVDAVLFAHLVDYKDEYPELLGHKSYTEIYNDIRKCVDSCHRDGVIKDVVMNDISKYVILDTAMVPMLKRMRHEGKKLFLVTNSMWDYTNCVMDYLVHGNKSDTNKLNPKIQHWADLFDVVIVGAAKPAFLTDDHLTLFQIDPSDGLLRNIEDKSNLRSVFIPGSGGRRVFQGGHWPDLQKLLAVSAGDKIMYVGDHVYSDVLKSKRNLGWRTCLIIPELDYELFIGRKYQHLSKQILHLRQLQYDLDEYMDMLRQKQQIASLFKLTSEYHSKFNTMWGPLFKAGYQDSRFAKQVSDYACLYTSRASNLGFVDPNRKHRTTQALMPHDQLALDIELVHTNTYYDI